MAAHRHSLVSRKLLKAQARSPTKKFPVNFHAIICWFVRKTYWDQNEGHGTVVRQVAPLDLSTGLWRQLQSSYVVNPRKNCFVEKSTSDNFLRLR